MWHQAQPVRRHALDRHLAHNAQPAQADFGEVEELRILLFGQLERSERKAAEFEAALKAAQQDVASLKTELEKGLGRTLNKEDICSYNKLMKHINTFISTKLMKVNFFNRQPTSLLPRTSPMMMRMCIQMQM